MLKAAKIREQLTSGIPWLKDNPANLWIGVRKGTLVATGQASASFEYRYHLEIVVMDYPGDFDLLSLVILAWAKVHQPDLIFNADKRAREVTFMADIISNDCCDILFGFPVDEARLVTTDDCGNTIITARDEPDYAEIMGLDAAGWDINFSGGVSGGPRDASSE